MSHPAYAARRLTDGRANRTGSKQRERPPPATREGRERCLPRGKSGCRQLSGPPPRFVTHSGPKIKTRGPEVRVPLKQPFYAYFTATIAPLGASAILDVLGQRAGAGNTVSYARIRLL